MKKLRILTIIIGDSQISAQGYFYMAIKESHNYDQIHVKSNKFFSATALVVAKYLELNGWQENEISKYDEKELKSRCTNCREAFRGQQITCTKCGHKCKEYSFFTKVIVMDKLGVLEAHQENIIRKEDTKEVMLYVEANKHRTFLKDKLIMRGWR